MPISPSLAPTCRGALAAERSPASAIFSPRMQDSFVKAHDDLVAAAAAMVKAVVVDGSDGAPTLLPAMLGGTVSDSDEELRLSLIRLKDGTWTFSPASEAVAKSGSTWTLAVAGAAKIDKQKEEWCTDKIDKIWPGVLCSGGVEGRARNHVN